MTKETIQKTNPDKIYSILSDYILHDKLHQAVMISAPWGTGKTWYIQKKFIPSFESQHKKTWGVIYVSLFGITNFKELDDIIYHQFLDFYLSKSIHKKIPSKAIRFGETALSIVFANKLGLSSEDEMNKALKLIPQPDHIVYILDDIERSGLNLGELFGYVNNLCEHENSRVILVANESQILGRFNDTHKDKDKNNSVNTENIVTDEEKRIEAYYSAKEKTVGLTIKFQAAPDEVFEQVLNKVVDKREVQNLIRQEKNFILDLFTCSSNNDTETILNLRVLAFIDVTIADLYDSVKQYLDVFGKDNSFNDCLPSMINTAKNKIILDMVRYTALECFKFKMGKNLDGQSFSYLGSSNHYIYFLHIFPFVQRYIKQRIMNQDAVANYLKIVLKEEMVNQRLTKSVFPILNEWWLMNDLKVEKAIEQLEREEIPEGVGPEYIRGMMITLITLRERGFSIPIQHFTDKIIKYLNSMDKISFNNSAFSIVSIFANKDFIDLYNRTMKPVYDYVSQRLLDASLVEYRFLIDLQWDEEFPIKCRNHIASFSSDRRFLSIVSAEKISDKLKNANPGEIWYFCKGIREVYNISNVSDFYRADYETVDLVCKVIRDLIQQYEKHSLNKVKTSNLKMLLNLLDQTREKME